MNTTITGFHQDQAGDWVAELGCGHTQHMRHRPPWLVRVWVTTTEGRQSKLGAAIDCPLCDSNE
jgi:tellurite methyltransferase